MSRLLLLAAALAACGHDDTEADANACEYFASGQMTAVTATVAKDSGTPAVSGDHMVYAITLPASGVGYVRFTAPEATEFTVWLDRAVPFAVQNEQSMPVSLESATSSEACATIKGKHTFALPVGVAYFALGPDSGGPVNLVAELAGGHSH